MSSHNRIDVDMRREPQPLLVRTGAFLRHPDSTLIVPHKTRLIGSRLAQQLYWLFRVRRGRFVLTTPFGQAHITRIDLAPSQVLFIKLQHLLAFSDGMFPRVAWKLDLTSLLAGQLRYIYLRGGGRVYLFGLGELSWTDLTKPAGAADFDPGAVLGFTSGLRVGIASRLTFAAAALGREEILLDRFVGEGRILTQASTARRLPHPFNYQRLRLTLGDLINALLGLRG
jgi:uncharacterized protein (AIM24 family)